jgi:hypothetical protein
MKDQLRILRASINGRTSHVIARSGRRRGAGRKPGTSKPRRMLSTAIEPMVYDRLQEYRREKRLELFRDPI